MEAWASSAASDVWAHPSIALTPRAGSRLSVPDIAAEASFETLTEVLRMNPFPAYWKSEET
jgi:hypothetical protein